MNDDLQAIKVNTVKLELGRIKNLHALALAKYSNDTNRRVSRSTSLILDFTIRVNVALRKNLEKVAARGQSHLHPEIVLVCPVHDRKGDL